MRATEFISELRRNPHQNTPVNQREHLADYLRSLPREQLSALAVSMTTEPKLGINPRSKYNTPIGIYFYPAAYFLRYAREGLPFQDDAPNLQLFHVSGPIMAIDDITDTEYRQLVERLFTLAPQMRISGPLMREIVGNAPHANRHNSPGGWLWYILYRMSGEGAGRDRAHVMWNWLIRQLGYVAVTDNQGIIHENEPVQGVVVDPRAVQDVQSFKNDTLRKDIHGDPVHQTLRVQPNQEPYRFFKQILGILGQLPNPEPLLKNQSRSHYMVSNFARLLKHNPAWNRDILDVKPLQIAQAIMPQANLVGDWVLWRWNNITHPHVADLLDQAQDYLKITDAQAEPNWRTGAANFREAMGLIRMPQLWAQQAGVELPGYDRIAAQLDHMQQAIQQLAQAQSRPTADQTPNI